jgi:RNA polymerase sigma-70 factor (ECF subfamily)
MAEAMATPQGDPQTGFESFYRCNYRFLVKVVLTAGATLDEAYEAVDQTMEEVLRRWSELDHPRAYARRAVLSNFIKTRSRDRQRLVRTLQGGHLSPELRDDHELNVWEDEQWVAQLLAQLPPTQREVMRCLVDGLTSVEIAELLGKTPEAIRQNARLARKKLLVLLRPGPGVMAPVFREPAASLGRKASR